MLAPLLAQTPEQIQSASLIYLSKHKRKARGETDYEEIPKEMVQAPLTEEQKGLLISNIIQKWFPGRYFARLRTNAVTVVPCVLAVLYRLKENKCYE